MGTIAHSKERQTMTNKTRFLVLDRTNTALRPSDHGLVLGDATQSDRSPSFTDGAVAGKFATLLAQQNPGKAYYVATVTAVAIAQDNIDAHIGAASELRPVTLTPTV